jgi:hypothetical protein
LLIELNVGIAVPRRVYTVVLTTTSPTIQVTQTGVEIAPEALGSLRAEYIETGIVMLPEFLAPPVLRALMKNLENAHYEEQHEVTGSGARFGTTLKIRSSDPVVTSFFFILNRPPLFDAVRAITGCEALGNYTGRIHRTTPGGDRHIDWHDDVYDFRTVGLNINLSRQSFQGGAFHLRDAEKCVRKEVDDWSAGDAFLFQISPGWQHRLTPVTAGERTVGVGWFRTRPSWEATTLSHFRSGVINRLAEDSRL